MNIAVDLDNTLCKESGHWSEYEKCIPIGDHIKVINQLFEQGHYIVIYTARYEKDRIITVKWLSEHGVRYHQLVLNKLRADKYIDQDSMTMGEAYATFILGRPRQLHRMALPEET